MEVKYGLSAAETVDMASVGSRLRVAMGADGLTVIPTVSDAFSARLVTLAGYPAAVMGGSAVTNALPGLPEAGFLSLSDSVFMAERTAAVAEIPVLVDADGGFGNAVNAAHAVRRLERAGAAGIIIADQSPVQDSLGGFAGRALSPSEMGAKIKGGCRRTSSILISSSSRATITEFRDRGNEAALDLHRELAGPGPHSVSGAVTAF
jgi:2-methylisocitrate lyase-like PEP mutase family enzyme